MSDEAKQVFQLVINNGYLDFITSVAESRGMSVEDVDAIGQGQVWTGADALEHGLIDELGGLSDAIAAAAELAELDDGDYGVKTIEQRLSPTEQMIIDLLGSVHAFGVDMGRLGRNSTVVDDIAATVVEKAGPLLRFNDPKGVYAHCLCDFR